MLMIAMMTMAITMTTMMTMIMVTERTIDDDDD